MRRILLHHRISAGCLLLLSVWLLAALCLPAQQQVQAAPVQPLIPSESLSPVLGQVQASISSLTPAKWKAPKEVKATVQAQADSIHKDIQDVLPGLLAQSAQAPTAIGPALAVYQNLNALYDVLLRVANTASLAGSDAEANLLETARTQLEQERKAIGSVLLDAANKQDAENKKLKLQVSQLNQSSATPHTSVVNDGPSPAKKSKKKAVSK